jgi:hypothetical protein
MTAIKITVDAAMRARDVSRPDGAAEEHCPAPAGQTDLGFASQADARFTSPADARLTSQREADTDARFTSPADARSTSQREADTDARFTSPADARFTSPGDTRFTSPDEAGTDARAAAGSGNGRSSTPVAPAPGADRRQRGRRQPRRRAGGAGGDRGRPYGPQERPDDGTPEPQDRSQKPAGTRHRVRSRPRLGRGASGHRQGKADADNLPNPPKPPTHGGAGSTPDFS